MPTPITPTPGRVMLFHVASAEFGDGSITIQDANQPMPAIVTFVNPDGTVNLSVFDHNGRQFTRLSVPVVQDGQSPPTEEAQDLQGVARTRPARHAHWMSYQIDQQAKQNAAVAAATVGPPAPTAAPTPTPAV